MRARKNGWYWCRIDGTLSTPKLHVFEWIDDYWQVYDCLYNDEDIVVVEGPLREPKEIILNKDDFTSKILFYIAFITGVLVHGTLALIRKIKGVFK
jgi:hypothetical protein